MKRRSPQKSHYPNFGTKSLRSIFLTISEIYLSVHLCFLNLKNLLLCGLPLLYLVSPFLKEIISGSTPCNNCIFHLSIFFFVKLISNSHFCRSCTCLICFCSFASFVHNVVSTKHCLTFRLNKLCLKLFSLCFSVKRPLIVQISLAFIQ